MEKNINVANFECYVTKQVKPSGSPVPTITGAGMSLSNTGSTPIVSTIIQNVPVSVAVTVPIPMTKFQAAIRPGATVTLAPRVVPAALVSTSGTYANLSSHVPKGVFIAFILFY
jgi:hypothetical protein